MLYPSNKHNINIDDFMDEVYDWVDELFLAGDFDKVNRWIGDIRTDLCDLFFLSFILTITLPAKDKLSNRVIFLDKCKMLKVSVQGLE